MMEFLDSSAPPSHAPFGSSSLSMAASPFPSFMSPSPTHRTIAAPPFLLDSSPMLRRSPRLLSRTGLTPSPAFTHRTLERTLPMKRKREEDEDQHSHASSYFGDSDPHAWVGFQPNNDIDNASSQSTPIPSTVMPDDSGVKREPRADSARMSDRTLHSQQSQTPKSRHFRLQGQLIRAASEESFNRAQNLSDKPLKAKQERGMSSEAASIGEGNEAEPEGPTTASRGQSLSHSSSVMLDNDNDGSSMPSTPSSSASYSRSHSSNEDNYNHNPHAYVAEVSSALIDPETGKRRRVVGQSCHQCKTRRLPADLIFCAARHLKKGRARKKKKERICRKKYCARCLTKFYHEEVPPKTNPDSSPFMWTCPGCRGECSCAACKRHKERKEAKEAKKALKTAAKGKAKRIEKPAVATVVSSAPMTSETRDAAPVRMNGAATGDNAPVAALAVNADEASQSTVRLLHAAVPLLPSVRRSPRLNQRQLSASGIRDAYHHPSALPLGPSSGLFQLPSHPSSRTVPYHPQPPPLSQPISSSSTLMSLSSPIMSTSRDFSFSLASPNNPFAFLPSDFTASPPPVNFNQSQFSSSPLHLSLPSPSMGTGNLHGFDASLPSPMMMPFSVMSPANLTRRSPRLMQRKLTGQQLHGGGISEHEPLNFGQYGAPCGY